MLTPTTEYLNELNELVKERRIDPAARALAQAHCNRVWQRILYNIYNPMNKKEELTL